MMNEIIDFWFSDEVKPLWFKSTPEFDQQLREKYESLWQQGVDGELETWTTSPEGCLALVILFDQFPLNIFRNQAQGYSTEQLARNVADLAIVQGFDQQLTDQQKSFLYLPFMHSENLDDQARAVELFDKAGLGENLRFAHHHYAIVEKYGRFPHRNEVLGRQSTQAEIDYLNSKEAFTG